VLSVALPASAIPPPPAQLAAQCESPTYASDVAVCADESLLALDRQVRALFESPPQDDWTPFVRHERDGSQLRLFPLEGPVLTCALREPD